MTITEARALLLAFAANKGETSIYGEVAQDHAIMAIGEDVITFSDCTLRTDSVTLTSGSDALPALPTNFLPNRLRRAYLTGSNVVISAADDTPALQPVDYMQILKMRIMEAEEGQPTEIGFDSLTGGYVYPKPDENYTLKLQWLEPFTTWTAGTADGTTLATVLNVKDQLLRQAIMTGGVYMLHKNMPNSKYARESFAAYQRFLASVKDQGHGSLGGRVTYSRPRW